MPFLTAGTRVVSPDKLPMEELSVTAESLANTMLDENNIGFVIICENFVSRYMQRVFYCDFTLEHTSLGHKFSIVLSYESRNMPRDLSVASDTTLDYHSPYYKLEMYKNLADMGTHILRDLIYLIQRGAYDMGAHILFRGKSKFDLLESATYVDLLEDIYKDL